MNTTTKILSAVLVSSVISGCGIGQKNMLFTTRTNVGLDVDAKQFTAQLNIDRQEAVIGPTFEGGQHVPIAAAFRNDNRLLAGFGVSSLFAGGDAALALTTPPDPKRKENESLISLSELPKFERGRIGRFFDWINLFTTTEEDLQNQNLPGPGQVKPFIFDTDTSLGIKLAWTGATAEFPDKVKIGFNREEFVFAPITATESASNEVIKKQKVIVDVFAELTKNSEQHIKEIKGKVESIEENKKQLDLELVEAQTNLNSNKADKSLQDKVQQAQAKLNNTQEELERLQTELKYAEIESAKLNDQLDEAQKNSYRVGIPSFFAALDSASGLKDIKNTEIGFRQVFAAGRSATNIANNPDLRIIINDRFLLSNASLCLSKWLKADNTDIDKRDSAGRAKALQEWLDAKDHTAKTIDELINNPFEWQAFVAKNISSSVCQNNR